MSVHGATSKEKSFRRGKEVAKCGVASCTGGLILPVGGFFLLEKPNERCNLPFPIFMLYYVWESRDFCWGEKLCLQHGEHGNMLMLADKAISAAGDTLLNREIQIHGWMHEQCSLKVLDVHSVKHRCWEEFSHLISMCLNTRDFQIEHTEQL